MQEFDNHTIRRVDWQNVFPVVLLPRAYKFALEFRVIVLAFFGLALTSVFAICFFSVLGTFDLPEQEPMLTRMDSDSFMPPRPFHLSDLPVPPSGKPGDLVLPATGTSADWNTNGMTFSNSNRDSNLIAYTVFPPNVAHPWSQFTATGLHVFDRPLASLAWFVVMLVIWTWIGGMITRIVALRFAWDRRESFSQLFAFTRKKWLSYLGAMILPLVGIFFALLPVWLLGWLWHTLFTSLWVGDFIHWILTFPFALVAVLISIGFMLGWPLMIAAISAEGSDAFDAISRGFSYVYQRPVQLVFYHLCNLVIYTIGIAIVWFVFHQTITLIGYDPGGLMILFNSFVFACFWSSSTVIYFLLRRSCDATPFDQVYPGDIKKRTLPPFRSGKNGEPVLQTEEKPKSVA